MTATNHALTGAMIATVVKQPLLALPLALASHFVCDALPHFGIDLKFNTRAMYIWLILDGAASILFAGFLIMRGVNNPILLAVAGFLAMSPDFAWLYYGINNQLGKFKDYDFITKFHHKIQWYQKANGLVIDAMWALLMVGIILKAQ